MLHYDWTKNGGQVTTTVSPSYSFYVRVSCRKTATGFQFVNDVAGDNQIGIGSTPTSWNLQ